jgi:hypothetical protein
MAQQHETTLPVFTVRPVLQVQRQVRHKGQAGVVHRYQAGQRVLAHQARRDGAVGRFELGRLVHARHCAAPRFTPYVALQERARLGGLTHRPANSLVDEWRFQPFIKDFAMNNMFPDWLLPLWIIGAPLALAIVERLRTPRGDSTTAAGYTQRRHVPG